MKFKKTVIETVVYSYVVEGGTENDAWCHSVQPLTEFSRSLNRLNVEAKVAVVSSVVPMEDG